MTINKDFIINEWLPALRSGAFPQGKGSLCSKTGFCCLGVAQYVAVGKGYINAPEKDISHYGIPSMEFRKFSGFGNLAVPRNAFDDIKIPESLVDYAPMLTARNPLDIRVTSLNDAYALTFAQIADFIEANLEILECRYVT